MLSSTQQGQDPDPEIEETVENLEVLNSPEEKNEKSDFLTKFVTKPFKAVIKMAGLELSKCHYVSLSVNISAV